MSLSPGATLGPYTITAELGHGGMGVVYTAQDPRLKRQVAIKLLTPDLTRDATAKQRSAQQSLGGADAPQHGSGCARLSSVWWTPDADCVDRRPGGDRTILTASGAATHDPRGPSRTTAAALPMPR